MQNRHKGLEGSRNEDALLRVLRKTTHPLTRPQGRARPCTCGQLLILRVRPHPRGDAGGRGGRTCVDWAGRRGRGRCPAHPCALSSCARAPAAACSKRAARATVGHLSRAGEGEGVLDYSAGAGARPGLRPQTPSPGQPSAISPPPSDPRSPKEAACTPQASNAASPTPETTLIRASTYTVCLSRPLSSSTAS